MPTHATLTALFENIADTIRAKTGGTASLVADDFPTAIAAIPAGGGLPFKTGSVTVSNATQITFTHNMNTLKVVIFYWATAGTITVTTAVRECFGLLMPHIDNVLGEYYQYLADGTTKVKSLVKPFTIVSRMSANTTSTSFGYAGTNNAVSYPSTQTVNAIAVKNTGGRWNGTFNWIAIDISGGLS